MYRAMRPHRKEAARRVKPPYPLLSAKEITGGGVALPFVICDFNNERRGTGVPASYLRNQLNVRIIPAVALLQTPPFWDEEVCGN